MDRREFIKTVHKLLITIGGANFFTLEELEAFDLAENRPDIIWLQALSCDGCAVNFLNAEIPVTEILNRFANIVFHPNLMAADGEEAMDILINYKSENLLLVVEGAIPTAMPHACMMGDKFVNNIILEKAKIAKAVVAAGTCATFAGICDMKNMYTKVLGDNLKMIKWDYMYQMTYLKL
jgi:hydrogenase small subunit